MYYLFKYNNTGPKATNMLSHSYNKKFQGSGFFWNTVYLAESLKCMVMKQEAQTDSCVEFRRLLRSSLLPPKSSSSSSQSLSLAAVAGYHLRQFPLACSRLLADFPIIHSTEAKLGQ